MPGAGLPAADPAGAEADADVDQTGAYDVAALGGTNAVRTGGQIAGYRVEAEIGYGGMATVYRALDVKLGRRVALKILAPRLAEDESFRKRFIHESRAAAAVDHPNIVPVFEAGDSGGVLFIAMRYVGTGDVRTLLERQGSLPVDRAVAICAQVASALDAANARGLVHRDVKPANMLLAESAEGRADHVYLSDFGLSKHSLAPSGLTATGQFMGTLDYVAPEQIEGRAVDGRADQYSLACAAVEMLTGAPPFRRDENIALMWAQLSEAPPSLCERRPDLPGAIDRVMARALAKSPAERYPTCMDFAVALRAASMARPPGPGGSMAPGGIRTPTEDGGRLPRPTPADPLAMAADPGPGPGAPGAGAPAGPPAQWGRADGGGPSLDDAPTDLGIGAAWGQERPVSAPGRAPASAPASQSPVGTPPPAWGQSAAEARQADAGRSEGATADAARPAARWGPGAQSSAPSGSSASGSGSGSSVAGQPTQADASGAQQAQSGPASPGAGQAAEVARQAALWGREAQPGPGSSWGQAARLGPANLSTAPTSGSPAAPPASPTSYRPGAPSRQPADSPWSASPWPASAAANPAPSVPQPGSPAPWSSPPGAGGLYRADATGPADRQVSPDLYRSARIPAPTAPRPPAQRRPARRQRRGPGVALGLAAGIVALLAAALGYKFLHHTTANSGTGPGTGPSTKTVTEPVPRTPPAVVRAYFAAIDQKNYALAWRLGGKYTGDTRAEYVEGFAGTAHDTVRILGVSGDIVRARVLARQTNGQLKVFAGTYTVANGMIVHSHIHRVYPRLR